MSDSTEFNIVHCDMGVGHRLVRWLANSYAIPAVVAGGYCRDYHHGKAYRDIDLYIRYDDFNRTVALVGEFNKNLAENIELFEQSSSEYQHQSIAQRIEVSASFDAVESCGAELFGHSIDVIGLLPGVYPELRMIIGNFNIGFNQIGVNYDYCMYTQHFRRDLVGYPAQFSILRTDWGYEKTAANIDKLIAKYGDRKIVDIDGNDINLAKFRSTHQWDKIQWAGI